MALRREQWWWLLDHIMKHQNLHSWVPQASCIPGAEQINLIPNHTNSCWSNRSPLYYLHRSCVFSLGVHLVLQVFTLAINSFILHIAILQLSFSLNIWYRDLAKVMCNLSLSPLLFMFSLCEWCVPEYLNLTVEHFSFFIFHMMLHWICSYIFPYILM